MSGLTAKLASLKPFSKKPRGENEDHGEEVDFSTVAGGGHAARQSEVKNKLRASRALRSFLVDRQALTEEDAGLDVEHHPPALKALIDKPHISVPLELTDRSYPLPDYFISSSHNTYLLAHQLVGKSSAGAYEATLRAGARCVEIDAWDNEGNKDEPKVTHGYTLVSHIPFRSVCETIRDVVDGEAASAGNEQGYRAAPILLSLENHCGASGQLRLAQIMKEVFGDRLLSKAIREKGHDEQEGGAHVRLEELGSKIVLIVEYHLPEEVDSSSSSDSDSDTEEAKDARKTYHQQKHAAKTSAIIVPELAALGVYAQSVKPVDNSWFEGELGNSPHHHLINVSESGLLSHLPAHAAEISRHNGRHLMRVFPKGTRVGSQNLRPAQFWGVGAQICALNWQTFGLAAQLNEALFAGTDGYVVKPAALRAGGDGLSTGGKKRLRVHVAGATDVPVPGDSKGDDVRPYVSCTLIHPADLSDGLPKRKTQAYRPHKLGFAHRGENPPATEPVWDEVLEWEYDDSELVFLRFLIKSDETLAANPMLAVAAVRLLYASPGWSFIRMLDLKGRETSCALLVKFEITDA